MYRPTYLTPVEMLRRATLATDSPAEKLTDRQREEVLASLRGLQAAEGLSNAAVSRVLRCSRSTWSQISRGLYQGDADRYLLRSRQWMTERLERAEAPLAEFVETSVGKRILAVCQRAWSVPCIGRVVTPAGCGKTSALLEFVRRRGDRAIYLQAGEAFSTRQGLISELAERLKIPVRSRSTSASLYRQVRDRLAGYYAGGAADPFCLLVDEATTLQPRALNVLRNLHDDRQVRLAVILADTWRLDAELHSRHGLPGGYEQLRGRCGAVYALPLAEAVSPGDVRLVAEAVLEAVGFEGRLPAESLKYLVSLAAEDGRLWNVVHRIWAVHDLAEQTRCEAQFTIAQLDFAAPLVGAACRMEHAAVPFGAPGSRPLPTHSREAVA
jgi:hypothetical protein